MCVCVCLPSHMSCCFMLSGSLAQDTIISSMLPILIDISFFGFVKMLATFGTRAKRCW